LLFQQEARHSARFLLFARLVGLLLTDRLARLHNRHSGRIVSKQAGENLIVLRQPIDDAGENNDAWWWLVRLYSFGG
jgi:hypothetical protein